MQPNFGHSSASGPGFHLDAWGDGPMVLRYRGKVWRFEFSEMFGPSLLTKENEVAVRQPMREDHPFWEAFNAWMNAGKKCRAVRKKRGKKLLHFHCHAPVALA